MPRKKRDSEFDARDESEQKINRIEYPLMQIAFDALPKNGVIEENVGRHNKKEPTMPDDLQEESDLPF